VDDLRRAGRQRVDLELTKLSRMGEAIDRARDAFDRQAWGRAYDHLTAAARDEPLEVDDLERLACAAYLVGRSDESSDVWAHASQECARIGEVARAARCAFWLAFSLLNRGELARGSGWVDRAQRLLDDRHLDCVEQGYLRYAAGLRTIFSGDADGARRTFAQAAAMGELYREAELTTLARIGQGRCAIYLGDAAEGVALLDEAMVAVTAREVSPIAVGDAYCTVIEGCHELFDVRRAREWTAALAEWCDAQPDLVLYRGECLIHRAEIMQLHGAWSDALEEVERPTPGWPSLRDRARWRRRCTCRPSCTAYGVSGGRPRTRTARPTSWAGTHSLASRCYAWPRVGPTPPAPPSAGRSTKPRIR
jgi:hypothetical protein